MSDNPDYILDINGLGESSLEPPTRRNDTAREARKWIGVQFECCGAYSRIYRNADGTAYEGHCPRCSKPVKVKIGPSGTHGRMFRAY